MLYDMSINTDQVRALRESRGWSQEHLAEVAGLSLRTIQRVESEGRGSRETKLSLAAAFDVPLGRLSPAGSAASSQAGGAEAAGITLTAIGTLLVVFGLIAGVNLAVLVAGCALLVSGLVTHAIDYLNGMRRAAGLSPLLASPSAVSGVSVFVSGAVVLLLGLVVSGQLWWMPGAVLVAVGLFFMAWPWVLHKLVGARVPRAEVKPPQD